MFANLKLDLRSYTSLYGIFMSAKLTLFSYIKKYFQRQMRIDLTKHWQFTLILGVHTQVNRMSRSRRVLAIGGKQRILGLDMVCIETILLYLDSF